jgi:hypothetical protein
MQRWYHNGKQHRSTRDAQGYVLPAETCNGSQWWIKHGELHRDDRNEDGHLLPAVTLSDGDLYWYTNGKQYQRPDGYVHK